MDLGYSVCTPRNPKCTACPLSSRCLALAEVTALKRSKTSSFFGTSRDIEDAAVRASPNGKGKGKACTLCTPFDPSSCLGPSGDGVAHYPAKKVRKAVPEEETAVRIVEVVAGSEGVDDRRVLVVQRPEKGLLAGQWEFPAIDLPPGEESTPASRGMAIGKRLGALFGREAAAAMSGDGKVTERPIVRHVFSHQIRHYIPDAVLSATAAPAKPKDGRAKWMKRSEVDGLHLGKAMRLVWADHVAGEVRTTGKKATAKRKVVAVAPKKAKPKRKAESEDDDGFVVDDDVEVEVVRVAERA
jgi:A/G-specific adenine glycosylase